MKEIELTQGKVALVDDNCYEYLNQFKWHAHKGRNTWYARRNKTLINGKRIKILMHREILTPTEGLEVDHISGDGLDNRLENLRIVTRRENQQNRHTPKISRFPGVTFSKYHNKFQSRITFNGKQIFLGYYDNELQAFNSYRIAVMVIGEVVLQEYLNLGAQEGLNYGE